MNYHGFRYLTAHDFSSYCKELKINMEAFQGDLEFYEKEGVLLPVARIVKPIEYLIKTKESDSTPEVNEWEDLESLLFASGDNTFHTFDCVDENQKYIIKPALNNFRPWQDYKVKVSTPNGESYLTQSAEHYYHYWQAYQVYHLKSFSNSKKIPAYLTNRFFQESNFFDALSFFIFARSRERQRVLKYRHSLDELNKDEFDQYSLSIKKYADLTLERFGLKIEDLYNFLVSLLNYEQEYRQNEKYLLSNEIQKDIFGLASLISYKEGNTFDQITKSLEQKGYYWPSKHLRELDPFTSIIDTAQKDFEYYLDDYNNLFVKNYSRFTKEEIKDLLTFLDNHQIVIVAHSIYHLVRLMNSSDPIWFASIYMGLNGLLIGLESFLIEVIKETGLEVNNPYMYDRLCAIYKKDGWWGTFENTKNELKAIYKDDSLPALFDLVKNDELEHVAKAFLIVYFSRNLAFHRYTYQPEFYDTLYSPIYKSICYTFLYTWSYCFKAKR